MFTYEPVTGYFKQDDPSTDAATFNYAVREETWMVDSTLTFADNQLWTHRDISFSRPEDKSHITMGSICQYRRAVEPRCIASCQIPCPLPRTTRPGRSQRSRSKIRHQGLGCTPHHLPNHRPERQLLTRVQGALVETR